jgi:hypothetical protein
MIIYAIVTDEELTDGIPALFLNEQEANEYAEKLNGSNIETDTYIVVATEVQEPSSRWTDCP